MIIKFTESGETRLHTMDYGELFIYNGVPYVVVEPAGIEPGEVMTICRNISTDELEDIHYRESVYAVDCEVMNEA